QIIVTSLHLKWNVDFLRRVIAGFVTLTAERKGDTDHLILDTRDIKIMSVKDEETGQALQFTLDKPHPNFGAALSIVLSSANSKVYRITIEYEVSPSCSALQWLSPEQTAGKKQPYMFSQCQAIHCRSLIPCQ
ncbi:Leukotriene A-4 hydrolase, partial [Halocaridina rubra]